MIHRIVAGLAIGVGMCVPATGSVIELQMSGIVQNESVHLGFPLPFRDAVESKIDFSIAFDLTGLRDASDGLPAGDFTVPAELTGGIKQQLFESVNDHVASAFYRPIDGSIVFQIPIDFRQEPAIGLPNFESSNEARITLFRSGEDSPDFSQFPSVTDLRLYERGTFELVGFSHVQVGMQGSASFNLSGEISSVTVPEPETSFFAILGSLTCTRFMRRRARVQLVF